MQSEKTQTVDGVVVRRHETRTALITGGTDGLGRALATAYRDAGWRVFVVGRSGRDELSGRFIRADLSDPNAHQSVVAALDALGVDTLDLIIHNAAGGAGGPLEQCPSASIEALVRLNVWSPIALTHALLSRVRPVRGKIVFIGSVAAFTPAPRYALYAATKAALDGFVRALAYELRHEVAVQIVHPGPIRTGFHARAGFTDLDTRRFPPPDRVASQVMAAIAAGAWRRFVDLPSRAIATACRCMPGAVDWAAARKLKPAQSGMRSAVRTREKSGAPRAVVTGAASGLGKAIADRWIWQGGQVLATDRSHVDAPPAADTERLVQHVADLFDPTGLDSLHAAIDGFGRVDLLVHCAGISAVGPFEHHSLESLRAVLWINFVAPVLITARALEAGVFAPDATLVFVSSLSHYVGYPGASVYAASKDGLAHFSRCVRVGLRGQGLNCLTLFPGPMRTPHAKRYAPPGASEARRADPAGVARALLAGVGKGRARLVPGAAAHIAAAIGTIAPSLSTDAMGRSLYQRLASVPASMPDAVSVPATVSAHRSEEGS